MVGQRYNKRYSIKEAEVEEYLVKQIKRIGGRAVKGKAHNQRGMPDRIIFMPGGISILIEVKRPGQVPRKNQSRMLSNFRKMGFQSTYASTFGEVDKVVKWIHNYCKTHKLVDVDHLCLRKDCHMRRNS